MFQNRTFSKGYGSLLWEGRLIGHLHFYISLRKQDTSQQQHETNQNLEEELYNAYSLFQCLSSLTYTSKRGQLVTVTKIYTTFHRKKNWKY